MRQNDSGSGPPGNRQDRPTMAIGSRRACSSSSTRARSLRSVSRARCSTVRALGSGWLATGSLLWEFTGYQLQLLGEEGQRLVGRQGRDRLLLGEVEVVETRARGCGGSLGSRGGIGGRGAAEVLLQEGRQRFDR